MRAIVLLLVCGMSLSRVLLPGTAEAQRAPRSPGNFPWPLPTIRKASILPRWTIRNRSWSVISPVESFCALTGPPRGWKGSWRNRGIFRPTGRRLRSSFAPACDFPTEAL